MKPKEHVMASRREFVRGATAGLAAALATPALAQQGSASPQAIQSAHGPAQSVKQDPGKQYPRPPFPPQQPQQRPGLASKMNPRPDHGEKSYQGSCRLVGRKALLTGGDSGIGRAAAIAFAR